MDSDYSFNVYQNLIEVNPSPKSLKRKLRPVSNFTVTTRAHNSAGHHKRRLTVSLIFFVKHKIKKLLHFSSHHIRVRSSISQSDGCSLGHHQRPRSPLHARPDGRQRTTLRTGSPPPNHAPGVPLPSNKIQGPILHHISPPRLRLSLLPLQRCRFANR